MHHEPLNRTLAVWKEPSLDDQASGVVYWARSGDSRGAQAQALDLDPKRFTFENSNGFLACRRRRRSGETP